MVKKEKPEPVDLIDRIPSGNFDLKKLSTFCSDQLRDIRDDRSEWSERRTRYLSILDNFMDYEFGDLPFEGASNLHIPVAFEKHRAVHSRLYQALMSAPEPFYPEPQEALDVQRLVGIQRLMKWALSRYVNHYKGINSVIDDATNDFSGEGFCFLRLRWERKMRKALIVEESINKKRGRPKTPKLEEGVEPEIDIDLKFEEIEKWMSVFEGPVLESINLEDVYFPGMGDIQTVPLVGIRTSYTGHDLKFLSTIGFFDKKEVEAVLEDPDGEYNALFAEDMSAKYLKSRQQGVKTVDKETHARTHENLMNEFEVYECYCTFDIDGDGFDEELVVWYHDRSKRIIRWTYLDRITKTSRRPIYKCDFIKRGGKRLYGIGLGELLYNMDVEMSAIHNQRMDYGTLTNLPFFFYNSGSSLPNQPIKIIPGAGVPVDDTSSIVFPRVNGGTAWGFQEEALVNQIIARLSSVSDMASGVVPSPGEALRTEGNMAAMMSEGSTQLNQSLMRFQDMLSDVYFDIHQMLVQKLPQDFQHMLIGEDNDLIVDPQTQLPITVKIGDPRKEIAGRVHFTIKANTAFGNKAFMKQNRLLLKQQLVDPVSIQLGIITAENLYNINKAILETSDEIDINRFITKPKDSPTALTLQQEIDSIKQGLMPKITMNDSHQEKVEMLGMFFSSEQVQKGLQMGTINPIALTIAPLVIQEHMKFAAMMEQAAQQQQQQLNQKAVNPPSAVPIEGPGVQQPPTQQGVPNDQAIE